MPELASDLLVDVLGLVVVAGPLIATGFVVLIQTHPIQNPVAEAW